MCSFFFFLMWKLTYFIFHLVRHWIFFFIQGLYNIFFQEVDPHQVFLPSALLFFILLTFFLNFSYEASRLINRQYCHYLGGKLTNYGLELRNQKLILKDSSLSSPVTVTAVQGKSLFGLRQEYWTHEDLSLKNTVGLIKGKSYIQATCLLINNAVLQEKDFSFCFVTKTLSDNICPEVFNEDLSLAPAMGAHL